LALVALVEVQYFEAQVELTQYSQQSLQQQAVLVVLVKLAIHKQMV
jgi:hypothetical protein